jgi:hypothetical protein
MKYRLVQRRADLFLISEFPNLDEFVTEMEARGFTLAAYHRKPGLRRHPRFKELFGPMQESDGFMRYDDAMAARREGKRR